jgi:hypothetical protein
MPKRKELRTKLSEAESFLDTGKFDGKDYDEMFALCEKLLSDERRKDKFLKGIPLYDPSKLYKHENFKHGWTEPDGKSPYDRIDEEIHKWNREDYAKQIILAIALSILSKHYAERTEEAEEFIKLIKKEAPTAWLKVWYEINISRLGARLSRDQGGKSRSKTKRKWED